MARITLSPLIVDVRAKVADMVFSKWKGTNYVRSRVTPANPNTVDQQTYRNAVKRLVLLWQFMDQYMRDTWNTYASGSGISGWNAFMSANIKAATLSLPLIITKTNGLAQQIATWASSSGSTGYITVQYAPTPVISLKRYDYFAVRDDVSAIGTAILYRLSGDASPAPCGGLVTGALYYVYGIGRLGTLTGANDVSDSLCSGPTAAG